MRTRKLTPWARARARIACGRLGVASIDSQVSYVECRGPSGYHRHYCNSYTRGHVLIVCDHGNRTTSHLRATMSQACYREVSLDSIYAGITYLVPKFPAYIRRSWRLSTNCENTGIGGPAASTTEVASNIPKIYLVGYSIVGEGIKLNICAPYTSGFELDDLVVSGRRAVQA